MNKCKSAGGAALLRQWFKAPSTDLAVIQMRQEHVAYFVECGDLRDQLRSHLKSLPSLSCLLRKFGSEPAKLNDWRQLVKVRTTQACEWEQ